MPNRILVSVWAPKIISASAMKLENPEPHVTVQDLKDVMSHLIGTDRARMFLGQHGTGVRALEIRFSEGKSAYHSAWLEFESDAAFEAFEEMKIPTGIVPLRNLVRAQANELTATLTSRLATGYYDLGKLEPKFRSQRARDFLERKKDLKEFSDRLLALDAVEKRCLDTSSQ